MVHDDKGLAHALFAGRFHVRALRFVLFLSALVAADMVLDVPFAPGAVRSACGRRTACRMRRSTP
jgi:hypothetical protein